MSVTSSCGFRVLSLLGWSTLRNVVIRRILWGAYTLCWIVAIPSAIMSEEYGPIIFLAFLGPILYFLNRMEGRINKRDDE